LELAAAVAVAKAVVAKVVVAVAALEQLVGSETVALPVDAVA